MRINSYFSEDRSRKHKVPRQVDDHEEQPENTVMYSKDIYSNEESDEEHYEPEDNTETETESDTGAASSQWSRYIIHTLYIETIYMYACLVINIFYMYLCLFVYIGALFKSIG